MPEESLEGSGLERMLRDRGLELVYLPVLDESPDWDHAALDTAAAHLSDYDWIVAASGRAVRNLTRARNGAPWPASLRSASVGPSTARLLLESGADPAPVVPPSAGAAALWATLAPMDKWPARRVLVLTTRGGGTTLADELCRAGADVDVVEAYRVRPRDPDAIRREWQTADADAVVIASGRSARALVDAIGASSLAELRAVVALGESAATCLSEARVSFTRAAEPSFEAAAETVAGLLIDNERGASRGHAS